MASSPYAIRRDFTGHVQFSATARVRRFTLPDTLRSTLLDVELTCHGKPETTLIGPADIRVYLNEHDVTSSFLASVIVEINKLPKSDVGAAYLTGVENYLSVVEKAQPAFGIDVQEHRQKAHQIANQGLAASLTKFCDRSTGWSGLLHPALYIFEWIPIAPLSLSTIWENYQASQGAHASPLKAIPLRSISFAQGWSPQSPVIGDVGSTTGELSYSLSFVLENPLRRFIEEIAQRLKDVDLQIEDLRVNYLNPTLDAVQQAVIEAQNGLNAVEARLKDIEAVINQIRPGS